MPAPRPAYQELNPLDLVFSAYDHAARRLGLPQGITHVISELGGRLDIPRVIAAIRALHRVYPASAARLEHSLWTGRPRWRLADDPQMAARAITVEEADDDCDEARRAWIETLLNQPLNLHDGPPLTWVIRRGPSGRDLAVVRFSHALTDARGGAWMNEEIARLDGERDRADALTSLGDESRPDFGPLLDPLSWHARWRVFRKAVQRGRSRRVRIVWLTDDALPANLGRLRCQFRHLTPEQTLAMRARSDQICGFGRTPDFIRACAIGALHAIMPPPPADAHYATLNVLDRRTKRQPLRMLSNLTTGVPVLIPASIAGDIARVADEIREQTGQQLADGVAQEHACALWVMTRIPTRWLGAIVASRLRPGSRRSERFGLAPSPSLPFGLLGPTSRPLHTFCGTPVLNYYGFSPPAPDCGFTIEANATDARLNVAGLHYDGRLSESQMARLLDGCVERLIGTGA